MRAAALSRSRKLAILRSEISRSVTCETNGASIQSMCRRRMFPSQMISEIIFPSKRNQSRYGAPPYGSRKARRAELLLIGLLAIGLRRIIDTRHGNLLLV